MSYLIRFFTNEEDETMFQYETQQHIKYDIGDIICLDDDNLYSITSRTFYYLEDRLMIDYMVVRIYE